jgi:hypothetical protein
MFGVFTCANIVVKFEAWRLGDVVGALSANSVAPVVNKSKRDVGCCGMMFSFSLVLFINIKKFNLLLSIIS